jgi:hypothetical protein
MKATDPHRDGDVSAFWEFTDDTQLRSGQCGLCRWCGAVHEGTAGYAVEHWSKCVGNATFHRAVVLGVDKAAAMRLAMWMYRDFPLDCDRAFDWSIRDLVTRVGAVDRDDSIAPRPAVTGDKLEARSSILWPYPQRPLDALPFETSSAICSPKASRRLADRDRNEDEGEPFNPYSQRPLGALESEPRPTATPRPRATAQPGPLGAFKSEPS